MPPLQLLPRVHITFLRLIWGLVAMTILLCDRADAFDPPQTGPKKATHAGEGTEKTPSWQVESDQGVLALQKRDYPQAEFHSRQAYIELLLADPQNDAASEQCLRVLARSLFRQAKYAEARIFATKALEACGRLSPRPTRLIAENLTLLGYIEMDDGHSKAAETSFLEARATIESVFGKESVFLCDPLSLLAMVYKETKRYSEADGIASLAITIREHASSDQSSGMADLLETRGETRLTQRRFEEGEADIRRAMEIRYKEEPRKPDRIAEDTNSIATSYMIQAKYEDAAQLFKAVARTRRLSLGPSHPKYGWALSNLATCYAGQGKWSEAKPIAREGFDILYRKENRPRTSPRASAHFYDELADLAACALAA